MLYFYLINFVFIHLLYTSQLSMYKHVWLLCYFALNCRICLNCFIQTYDAMAVLNCLTKICNVYAVIVAEVMFFI